MLGRPLVSVPNTTFSKLLDCFINPSGFLEPSGGTALVNGYDIQTDIANVRKTLGLCPQHNILFDLLTVEEHLKFFARVRLYHKHNQIFD